MSYSNYVNSFYSNDINILKKRRNQTKVVSVAAVATGTLAAGLSLLPKNKIPCAIAAVVLFLGALNGCNYIKQTDEKINALDTKV